MQSSAPSSRPTILSVTVPLAVTMMIGTSVLPLSVRHTSLPSRSGRERSSSTMSGFISPATLSASAPLRTIVGWKPFRLNAFAKGSAIESSSSMSSTLVVFVTK